MIHIGKDFYIGGEPLNITLYQKKIIQDGPNRGKEYYQELGYWQALPELLRGLTKRKIRLSVSQAKAFEDILADVQKIYDLIDSFCQKFEKEIKDRLKDEQETVKVPVYQIVFENENGAMSKKIGEEVIPARWKVKGIIFPLKKGDKQGGKAGKEDH